MKQICVFYKWTNKYHNSDVKPRNTLGYPDQYVTPNSKKKNAYPNMAPEESWDCETLRTMKQSR